MAEFSKDPSPYGPETDRHAQAKWDDARFVATIEPSKEKYYGLDMFPYPSGNGLHVGHVRGYVAGDVVARLEALKGKEVLRPMGWDAFGLPAEQYALSHGEHPRTITEKNTGNFRTQLESLGLSYDWSKEVSTTDPDFMKWTQWAFLKMYENGLVYESEEPINWCPTCKTGLSNEDLEGCSCERCGSTVEQRPIRQLKIRIKDYAHKLIEGMQELDGWDSEILEMQRNWIGLEQGYAIPATIDTKDQDSNKRTIQTPLYATNLSGLLGSTYATVAADSALLKDLSANEPAETKARITAYANMPEARRKQQIDMIALGSTVRNPISGENVPLMVDPQLIANRADLQFVTDKDKAWKRYAPGAPMSRGEIFDKYLIPDDIDEEELDELVKFYLSALHMPLNPKEVSDLQDWVFSRQRFWGEPIPLVHCDIDGTVPIPESDLPLELPHVETYSLTETGESPLAGIEEWVKTVCPHCGGPATRETNTMPQWAGSSWYFDRYKDPHNTEKLVGEEAEKYWGSVDLCIGGLEHATRHLIYARFWHRFLNEIGAVSTPEPFKSVRHVGLVLGADGRKMGKRYGNVVDPLEIVNRYGADVVRVYAMFMGDFAKQTPWDDKGMKGVQRFLNRVWRMPDKIDPESITNTITGKHVESIEKGISDLKFNVAVAQLMELSRTISVDDKISQKDAMTFLTLLAPFAPHVVEGVLEKLGVHDTKNLQWPSIQPSTEEIPEKQADGAGEYVIAINGKKVSTSNFSAAPEPEDIAALVETTGIGRKLSERTVRKVIVPNGRNIINFVVN